MHPCLAPTCPLPDGHTLPVLGLGTWRMGEQPARQSDEVRAVREALRLGYRLIDTAEMYGEGGAERVVGAALRAAVAAGEVRREDVTVVSKVYPHNASRAGVRAACERSLRRLGLEQIDIYLLHWRGAVPLGETLSGFADLQRRGWIRSWGVSNFDVADLAELGSLPGGREVVTNQVYYSLGARGIEHDLLPWMQSRNLPLMAYSPIEQGLLGQQRELAALAGEVGCTAAQLALAWVLRQPGVVAIPKAVQSAHLRENLAAATLRLDEEVLARLDVLFPPPRGKQPLAMI